jgi:hypothetical protein
MSVKQWRDVKHMHMSVSWVWFQWAGPRPKTGYFQLSYRHIVVGTGSGLGWAEVWSICDSESLVCLWHVHFQFLIYLTWICHWKVVHLIHIFCILTVSFILILDPFLLYFSQASSYILASFSRSFSLNPSRWPISAFSSYNITRCLHFGYKFTCINLNETRK